MILAIESTCDETSVAIARKQGYGVRIEANVTASSAEMAVKYGGVVPEIAAREQVASIIPVVYESIKVAAKSVDQLEIEKSKELISWARERIEGIAVSYGPGLMGSLLVGTETARTLSVAWDKKLYRVNHLTGHMCANWIINNTHNPPSLPAVGFIVSGGHTDIIYLDEQGKWEWIGGTRDDAAGEAFDKAARLLNLPYPGGPAIQEASARKYSEQVKVSLPRPMIEENNLDMSFSGLKTAVSRLVSENYSLSDSLLTAIAREFNEAVSDVLVSKAIRAVKEKGTRSLLLAGGVAANKLIRERMEVAAKKAGCNFYCPDIKYCTDNAAMIGAASIIYPNQVEFANLKAVPNLTIEQ